MEHSVHSIQVDDAAPPTAPVDEDAAFKPKSGKRGRKQDDTLPPSRARDVQRAFRARRAEKIATLESRVKELEGENTALRLQFSLSNGSQQWASGSGTTAAARAPPSVTLDIPTTTLPSSLLSPLAPIPTAAAATSSTPRPSEAYANQFESNSWPPVGLSLHPTNQTSSSTEYDPNYPSSPGLASANVPPPLPTPFPRSQLALNVPSSRSGTPPIPTTDEIHLFLVTCCSIPASALKSPTPYQVFCGGLMKGLVVTGKGRSKRLSRDNPTLSPATGGPKLDVTGEVYEDSTPTGAVRPGYISALAAWNALSPYNVSGKEAASVVIQVAGGPGDGSAMGGGQGIRCEAGHGLILADTAIKAAKAHLERLPPVATIGSSASVGRSLTITAALFAGHGPYDPALFGTGAGGTGAEGWA